MTNKWMIEIDSTLAPTTGLLIAEDEVNPLGYVRSNVRTFQGSPVNQNKETWVTLGPTAG